MKKSKIFVQCIQILVPWSDLNVSNNQSSLINHVYKKKNGKTDISFILHSEQFFAPISKSMIHAHCNIEVKRTKLFLYWKGYEKNI